MKETIKIGIVDDHKLFRKGLISLLEMIDLPIILHFEAKNGIELQEKLKQKANNPPEIILMDINMPKMDGFESVVWLQEHYPRVHILVVSMIEKEEAIVRMVKLGVKGYLSKDVEPNDLKKALLSITNKGFYYTDYITGKLVHSLKNDKKPDSSLKLNELKDREREFLQLVCTEFTYSQIADKMFLSPKTIDGYRTNLFEKFSVKNRVGLALYAIREGWVKL